MFFVSFFFSFSSSIDSDLSDYPFPSVSACPSLANSPVVARRDSILKHSGSVKNTDRRVSIKQNQPIVLEYLSEKRPSMQLQHAASITNTAQQHNTAQSSTANGSFGKSNARPASLILTKGDRPTFKLIRTPSIDEDQDDVTVIHTTNFTDLNAMQQRSMTTPMTNVNHHLAATDLNAKDDDDEDESAPLVQYEDKELTKISSSINHS